LAARKALAIHLHREEEEPVDRIAKFLRCHPTAIENWLVQTPPALPPPPPAEALALLEIAKADERAAKAAGKKARALATLAKLEKSVGVRLST
jgi:hypothetical protein